MWHESDHLRIPMWGMSLIYMCDTGLIHMCHMNPALIHRYDTRLIHCVTWLVHMSDMTHPYVRHESTHPLVHMCDMILIYMFDTGLIHVCDMRLIHVCDMSLLIHMCDMTRSYVCHDSFVFVT